MSKSIHETQDPQPEGGEMMTGDGYHMYHSIMNLSLCEVCQLGIIRCNSNLLV